MTRIIACANQKGGVGKTTTTINLAASLAHLGKRVLVVDMDPQGNSSAGLSAVTKAPTVYNVLNGAAVTTAIRPTEYGVDIIPAGLSLCNAEQEMVSKMARELQLSKALAQVRGYDFILIDCNPSIGILTANALVAADWVIIPMEPAAFSVDGLNNLNLFITNIRENINPKLKIMGYLVTRVDYRTTAAKEFLVQLQEAYGGQVFRTVIRQNSKLADSQREGMPVLWYDKAASGAVEYLELAKEVIERAN